MTENITMSRADDKIALDILRYSRQALLKQWPYLGPLLYLLPMQPSDEISPLGTDGKTLFYNPRGVIDVYKTSSEQIPRLIMHIMGHCLLNHIRRRKGREYATYDLASDLSVFQLLEKLPGGKSFAGDTKCRQQVDKVIKEWNGFTADSVYAQSMKEEETRRKINEIEDLIKRDDHHLWGKSSETESTETEGAITSMMWKQCLSQAIELYKKQEPGPMWGTEIGGLNELLQLKEAEHHISYEEILRRFTKSMEVLRVDMDSLDLAWYVSGLELYGDMPIIEYNEYKDINAIAKFVIAIDTSGSCCGDTLQMFLKQTAKVVEDMEIDGRKFCLRLIQCDYDIQEDVEVHTLEEFYEYISGFYMKGGGGTSFEPVFQRVNQLVATEGYEDLKGFLYFTDGCGDFPKKPVPYETVFVIPEEDSMFASEIPDWITVAYLRDSSVELQSNAV